MNDFKKTDENEVSAVKTVEKSSVVEKRRSFLKKAGTGVVISSLPAKSVWGACSVSGAMSGNMSSHGDRHKCELPPLFAGRSPGFWSDIETGVHGAFTALNGKHDPKRSCYIKDIEDFVATTSMGLEPSLITESDILSHALASNGGGDADANLFFHLAAVYLNSYYGFYGLGSAGKKDVASKLVNDILLYVYIETMKGQAPILDDAYWNMSLVDPTSDFQVTQSTGC